MEEDIETMRRSLLSAGCLNEIYEIGPVIGKGGFSTVRTGKLKADGSKEVALKILNPRAYLKDKVAAQQVFHEIKVMLKVNAIDNSNLMRFIAAHEDVSASTGLPRLTIVTPLYSGGELFDRIIARGHYSERDAAVVITKLAKAFLDLHANGIIHRDLKPENVLYENKSENAQPILADFGLARLCDGADVHTSTVGTPGYMSPEIIQAKKYTPAGDVWALGVLLYILLCGYPPFYAENNRELYRIILSGKYEFHADTWGDISAGAKDLVTKMLVVDDAARLPMKDVLSHPWITTLAGNLVTNLPKTLGNLSTFNARRKIKAAAAAVRLGRRFALRPELRDVLPDSEFNAEQLSLLSTEFNKVAVDGGAVSYLKFAEVMKALGFGGLPLQRIFTVFDEDGSGDVDYKELLCGLARLRGDNEAAVKACFDIFDVNSDGSLSLEELVRLLQATGVADEPELSPSKGAGAVGSSDEIEEEKLRAIEALFERIDSNKDGALSYAEFKAAVDEEPTLAQAIFKPIRRALSTRLITPPVAVDKAAE